MSEPYCVLVAGQDPARRAFEAAVLAELGMAPIFEGPLVRVFASADLPFAVLADGRGIIIGTMFARADHARTAQTLERLPDQDRAALWMIEHMWGRYVAILIDGPGRAINVLRDPTGLMACFSATRDGETAFAPDARILLRLGLISGAIDGQPLGLPLAWPDLRTTRTALNGVTDPTPGDVVKVRAVGMRVDTLWRPAHFCRRDAEIDFAGASQAVRDTVDSVMSAWAGSTDKILLSLSGGLDSSIIASSVPDAKQHLAAFNLRSGRGLGDERDFARELARAIGIDLAEFDISQSPVDVSLSLAADLPNPSARYFTQPADQLASALADRVGATAHMTGGGGDNVFAYLHSANPAADRLVAHGPGRGFVRTVLDLAELTQCTVPHVARRAISKAWWKPNRYRWPKCTELLSPDYLNALGEPEQPWLAGQEQLRPGQREHCAVLARAICYVHHLNIRDRRPTIYPLLSQPLVELCLSIPTWFSCRGGRDRAVARAAFADRLPPPILDRRTKGAFDGVVSAIYERNRTRIREMIFEGQLVHRGIVSRQAAESALRARMVTGPTAARLLHCAEIEAWATSWGGGSPGS